MRPLPRRPPNMLNGISPCPCRPARLEIMKRIIKQWPLWSGYAAAAWSLLYAVLGLYWTFGGAGFPFAPIDEDHRSGSILEGTDVHIVAPIMTVFGFAGAAVGLVLARGRTG